MKEIIVHHLPYCPYCKRVLHYLKENQFLYQAVNYEGKAQELIALKERTGHDTVPQVFFGEDLIGGAREFFQVVDAGELQSRLSKSEAST